MGCSSTSFEINKSKENSEEQKGDDLIKLKKRRMAENKEIANHDLTKIKKLEDDLDKNKKKDKINIEHNNNAVNKNIIFSQDEDNNENNEYINQKNKGNGHNIKQLYKSKLSNDAKKKDNNNMSELEIYFSKEINNLDETIHLLKNYPKNKISILDKYFKMKTTNKSGFNKTKTDNTTSKEPFTLKTGKNDSINMTTLKLNASFFLREYLIPIWFEKDAFVKFITSGKWRIDKSYDFTDTKGMPTPNTLDFNYGACVARIGSGDPFVLLPKNFTYITKTQGPLYLKMNLPRKIKVHPEGQIEINIYDGEVLPLDEIYRRIGWKENNMKYGNNKGSDIENKLMTTLNNLRMNPILFYEKYFRDIKNIIWIEKYLQEKEIKDDNNDKEPLKANDNCYNLIDNYVNNNYVNKKNINKQKVSLYLNDMKENLEIYLNKALNYKNLINCKLTQKYKVNDICLQYLLDKNFRNYIFSKEFNYIAVKIVANYIDESNLLILCFSKIDENAENETEDNENKKGEDIN